MADSDDLTVRPPKQERTRRAWERVLDAGVAILEEAGYEGFTIASVCERADVTAPTIYARVTSKEALFYAVYEHGMETVRADASRTDPHSWDDQPIEAVIRGAVAAVANGFFAHAQFLRAVILRSGADGEIKRRGSEYRRQVGEHFTATILRRASELTVDAPDASIDTCFRLVFSSFMMQVTHGADFDLVRTVSDTELERELGDFVLRYLTAPSRGPSGPR